MQRQIRGIRRGALRAPYPAGRRPPVDKVKIGFLTTLSGPQADLGQRHLDGFGVGLEAPATSSAASRSRSRSPTTS